MIRPEKEISSSTNQEASSSSQEASSSSTVPVETAPPTRQFVQRCTCSGPPSPRYQGETEIHPPESRIPGGAPIIPVKVGGGKQTYRGNIG
jgi:hypothetical protein